MRRFECVLGAATLLGLALLGLPQQAAAQGDAGKRVHFYSADGVKLVGSFYAGKKDSPTVLLLHNIGKGEKSQTAAWNTLAKTLQGKGFSVLSFDFRGHGQSTTVDTDKFWLPMFANRGGVKPSAEGPDQIHVQNFQASYLPVLVNDIAAAKAYLDRKNDQGECNTSSLVVVGAETGAILGAVWINSEWHRFQLMQQIGLPTRISPDAQGKNVIAAVWLTMTNRLGTRLVNVPAVLQIAGGLKGTPMAFMYGDEDAAGKLVATHCEKELKRYARGKQKHKFTGAVEIKGAQKLRGSGLLVKSLRTDEAIADYIDNVSQAQGNEYKSHGFRKAQYIWRVPGNPRPVPANIAGEDTFNFYNFAVFLR